MGSAISFWPNSNSSRPRDFDIAEIAREELRNMIITFNETKPSTFQRLGLQKGKSTKAKAIEVLEEAVRGDFNDLKASIDEMEEKWKSNHGPVSSLRIFETKRILLISGTRYIRLSRRWLVPLMRT
jgi:hypothetical protein